MKAAQITVAFIIGILIGAVCGNFLGRTSARVAVLSGPYSDNFQPALAALGEAKAKIQAGDTNVLNNLREAEAQIIQAQRWSERFVGNVKAAANSNQQMRSETNRPGK
jgi:3-deoxy-D-manno-octulosonic-acid transferase